MDKVEVKEDQVIPTGSIKSRYNLGYAERNPFLERAREAAEITIPSLLPREGHSSANFFKQPFQSVGARGVNNLASKLLLALLPPNSPFFRLTIDDFDLENLVGPNQRGAVEEGLARIERSAMGEIEAKAIRVPVFEALKHLIVTGNALVYMPKDGGMRVFRLDRYVVKRDAMGNVLEIITVESLSPLMLPEEVRSKVTTPNEDYGQKNYDLYTCVKKTESGWEVRQEVEGQEIESSYGTYEEDKNPFIPLRFTRIDSEDYGRGFVEEYIGDLKSLEALTRSIVEGSASAAKVLFMVRPNGTTKLRSLAESPNGAIVQGAAEDVSVLQVNKFNDFRVAQEVARQIQERISYAFLLNSAVQRQAERVTAEEIRFAAQELEMALGGVYSVLSQEFQVPLVNLLLNRLEQQKKMPKFPKDSLKPQIVTGIEALGRGQDLNKLATFLQYLQPLGPQVLGQELNVTDYLDRLGASLGIDTNGLIKSQEQKQQEMMQAQQQQQAQMQSQMMGKMAERAVSNPEIVKQVSESLKQNQQQQQGQ